MTRAAQAFALFGENITIQGSYYAHPRDVKLPSGRIERIARSFECRHVQQLGELDAGEPIEVQGFGLFSFVRELVPGGDEAGRTVIELR